MERLLLNLDNSLRAVQLVVAQTNQLLTVIAAGLEPKPDDRIYG